MILTRLLRRKRSIVDPKLLTILEVVAAIAFIHQMFIGNFWLIFGLTYTLGFCLIAGNHRLLAHRSWPCPRWLRNVLSLGACLALQSAPLSWVASHRAHHRTSDTASDVQSPVHHNRWWVHFLSFANVPDLTLALDLWKDPWQRFLFDYYWIINIAFTVILYLINPDYIIIWLATAFSAQMITFTITSIAHDTPWYFFPTRETIAADKSRNIPIVAMFSGGEAWHLNHHVDPSRWYNGRKWWQIDLTGIQIFIIIMITNPLYFLRKQK